MGGSVRVDREALPEALDGAIDLPPPPGDLADASPGECDPGVVRLGCIDGPLEQFLCGFAIALPKAAAFSEERAGSRVVAKCQVSHFIGRPRGIRVTPVFRLPTFAK